MYVYLYKVTITYLSRFLKLVPQHISSVLNNTDTYIHIQTIHSIMYYVHKIVFESNFILKIIIFL